MIWTIKFSRDGEKYSEKHPTPEAAMDAACEWMDGGYEVYAIGISAFGAWADRDHIAQIFELWVHDKYPLGRAHPAPVRPPPSSPAPA